MIPACETKIGTKNSNISLSDWLRSATTWGMWMGPLGPVSDDETDNTVFRVLKVYVLRELMVYFGS